MLAAQKLVDSGYGLRIVEEHFVADSMPRIIPNWDISFPGKNFSHGNLDSSTG